MSNRILVFYGSYRSDRMGDPPGAVRRRRPARPRLTMYELIDAKAVGLRCWTGCTREYPKGEAPAALENSRANRRRRRFCLITGEYNWGIQPALKKPYRIIFLDEWFWRPAAIASYSAGRFSGARPPPLHRHALENGLW